MKNCIIQILLRLLSEPKVSDLCYSVTHEYVGQLEVSMEELVFAHL